MGFIGLGCNILFHDVTVRVFSRLMVLFKWKTALLESGDLVSYNVVTCSRSSECGGTPLGIVFRWGRNLNEVRKVIAPEPRIRVLCEGEAPSIGGGRSPPTSAEFEI